MSVFKFVSIAGIIIVCMMLTGISVAQGHLRMAISPPEFLNSNAESDSGSDSYTNVATDSAGNWIAVWCSNDDLNGTIGTDYDILVSRSSDNGDTWTAPVLLYPHIDSEGRSDGGQQIETDCMGTWIVIWKSLFNSNQYIYATRSIDNGNTWSEPVILYEKSSFFNTRPELTTDCAGNWVVVWNCYFSGLRADIIIVRSSDNGIIWTNPVVLNTDGSDTTGDRYPHIAADYAGNLVAVWTRYKPSDYDIYVANSKDNGLTWSTPAILNIENSKDDEFPQVATDGDGNWVAVWVSKYDLDGLIGFDQDIFVSRSINNGDNWSTPVALNSNAAFDFGYDYFPRIISDNKGNWITVWMSCDDLGGIVGGDSDIFVSHSKDNGKTWTKVATMNKNSRYDLGNDKHPDIAMDNKGNCVTVWHSDESLNDTIGTEWDILVARSYLDSRQFLTAKNWHLYE
jgi:hypothetical protein